MNDLISRSELIKHFEAVQSQEDAIGLDFVAIIDEIKKQPTAYSVDKVVERLNRETISSSIKESLGLLKAIEIVKQGSVSDDVCEKMQMQAYNKAVDNCLKILYFHQNEYDGIQWAIREIEELKEMERD